MDVLSASGFVLVFFAIILGSILKGVGVGSLLNAQLRQRVDQMTSKQESIVAGNSRSTLRQAIALSKHGATTCQLIDTCALSQGGAHLIQNLYGRPPGDTQPDELH